MGRQTAQQRSSLRIPELITNSPYPVHLVRAFWVDGQSVIFNHQPINIMQIIDTLKDNLQLVKIEIGTPNKGGALHLQTICIAEEGSIDWDHFEALAHAQGKVIVDSYVG